MMKSCRTLVNHCNSCFDLNSSAFKLKTTYTSQLIFFGPILVSKAFLASLSLRGLREAKRGYEDQHVSGHETTLTSGLLHPTIFVCRLPE